MKRLPFLLALLFSFSAFSQDYYLMIGTYTNTGSKGIYVYRFNSVTGEVKWVSNTDSASNPSYLAITPNGKFVYAVYEDGGSQKSGQVSAYSFDKASGSLKFLNKQVSGDHPCYVAVTKDGKWVTAGNYS